MHDVQDVEQLPFVQVDTLDLDVKNGRCIDGHGVFLFNIVSHDFFACLLDLAQLFQEGTVAGIAFEV